MKVSIQEDLRDLISLHNLYERQEQVMKQRKEQQWEKIKEIAYNVPELEDKGIDVILRWCEKDG